MSNIYKGELQDNEGNSIYPHTEADIVFCADGKTAQEKLNKYENALGTVTGKTDSSDVSNSNILATSKAIKNVNDKFGGYKFTTKNGKIAYYKESEGADSAVPFNSVSNLKLLQYFYYNGTSATINIPSNTQFLLIPTYDINILTYNVNPMVGSNYILSKVGDSITFVDVNNVETTVKWESANTVKLTRNRDLWGVQILAFAFN